MVPGRNLLKNRRFGRVLLLVNITLIPAFLTYRFFTLRARQQAADAALVTFCLQHQRSFARLQQSFPSAQERRFFLQLAIDASIDHGMMFDRAVDLTIVLKDYGLLPADKLAASVHLDFWANIEHFGDSVHLAQSVGVLHFWYPTEENGDPRRLFNRVLRGAIAAGQPFDEFTARVAQGAPQARAIDASLDALLWQSLAFCESSNTAPQ
jgi:hypothetical protein